MRINTAGIFLGKIRFGDNGQILKIFTREAGLLSFVTKGVRSKKSAIAACHFALAPLQIAFDFREKNDLQHPTEIGLLRALPALYDDPLRASVAGFVAEVMLRALEDRYVNEALFDFMLERTEHLANDPQVAALHLHILMGMAERLGFAPNIEGIDQSFDLSEGVRCRPDEGRQYAVHGATAEAFIRLAQCDTNAFFSKKERVELTDLMLDYFKLHLPHMRPVRSLEVIKAVFG